MIKRKFHLLRPSPKTRLGPLEQQVLRAVWRRGNATVRELLRNGDIKLAYTTIMTTLDRLYKKELLNRESEGRAFRYSARYTQEELERAAAGETIRQLFDFSADSSLPLSYLLEAVSERDANLLDDLQRLLDEKRQNLRKEEKL